MIMISMKTTNCHCTLENDIGDTKTIISTSSYISYLSYWFFNWSLHKESKRKMCQILRVNLSFGRQDRRPANLTLELLSFELSVFALSARLVLRLRTVFECSCWPGLPTSSLRCRTYGRPCLPFGQA